MTMASTGAAGSSDGFKVRSSDGTSIDVSVRGQGRPIVLVHGSLRDHTVFEPLIAHLQPAMTTYAVDRRGFGRSGDGAGYQIEQEFADIALVVDAVAARAGPVTLWGHSYGANCAMGAATLTASVAHLVLYEPSLGLSYPPGWLEANEQALAQDDLDAVVKAVLTDILEMGHDQVAARSSTPEWSAYRRAAPTVLREARTEHDWVYRPGAFDRIRAPVVFLVGTETTPGLMRATLRAVAAVPGARTHVLEGHGHLACITHPASVASVITQLVTAARG